MYYIQCNSHISESREITRLNNRCETSSKDVFFLFLKIPLKLRKERASVEFGGCRKYDIILHENIQ